MAAALLGMAGSVSAAPGSSYHGTFSETAIGHDLNYDIHGSAKMTVGSASTTAVHAGSARIACADLQ